MPQLGPQNSSLPPPSSLTRLPPSNAYDDYGSVFDGQHSYYEPDARLTSRSTTPADFVSAGEIERLAGHRGVDVARLNEFNDMSLSRKLLEIFAVQLQQATSSDELNKSVKTLDSRVTKLDARTAENFKPSDAIKQALKMMTRHYLYQPVVSYQTVHESAANYYRSLPKENHPLMSCGYTKDKIIKDAIHKHLKELAGSERSHLRPTVWRMVQKRTTLSKWVKYMEEHYDHSGPNRSAHIVKQQAARLALMREVAEPLVPLPTARGQDTGFWHALEERLMALYAQLGPDIAAPSWDRWATDIIARDKLAYKDTSEVQFVPQIPQLDAQDPEHENADEE